MSKKIVIIDAGHGGYDPGAVGKQTTEKAIALQVVHRTVSKLLNAGIDARMTRSDDTFIELTQRSVISNNAKADTFVSVHLNSSVSNLATGAEVLFMELKDRRLADVVYPKLLKATGFADRGVKYQNVSVVRKTNAPAILCEIGFISNAKDESVMMGSLWQERVAQAITDGMCEFLGVNATPKPYKLINSTGGVMDELPVYEGSSYVCSRKLETWFNSSVVWDISLQKVVLNGKILYTKIINGKGYVKFRDAAEVLGLVYTLDNEKHEIKIIGR